MNNSEENTVNPQDNKKPVEAKPEVKAQAKPVEESKKTSTAVTPEAKPTAKPAPEPTKAERRGKGRQGKKEYVRPVPDGIEKVIAINRITKVTKGGKKLSFSALVVVGDAEGRVGYSLSKASEVATAIRKAITVAKRNMIRVPMNGSTITHEIIGQCSGSRVLLKPASEGTGVIASGPVRAVCDGAGIHNILTKCHRSNNPINVVKATINGLSRLKQVEVEEKPIEEPIKEEAQV